HMQEERRESNWEFLYSYIEASKYFEQVKAYQKNFKDILIILTEDLHKNPANTFEEIFSFLEVDTKFKVDQTIHYNRSGAPRSRVIHEFFKKDNKFRKAIQPLTHLLIPSNIRKKLFYKFQA